MLRAVDRSSITLLLLSWAAIPVQTLKPQIQCLPGPGRMQASFKSEQTSAAYHSTVLCSLACP